MKNTRTILAIVTLLAMMVTLFTVPTYAAEYKDGDVLYSEDFSNFDINSVTPQGYAVNSGALTTIEVKDGALHLVGQEWNADKSLKIGGRHGTRVVLYDIPDEIDRYSVSVDVYINEYLASSSSAGPSVLLTNNDLVDEDGKTSFGEFAMMWLRKYDVGTTGYYQYGETASNVVDKSQPGFCEAGTWYTVQYYVDLVNEAGPTGAFKIINKTTGDIFDAEDIIFNSLGHNNVVGVYNNVTDVIFDNVKVTYGDAFFGNTAPATPVETTAAPVETTAAPVETTAAPVETTAAPVETTAAPVETTAAPVETTAAPVETTAAPVETTAAPTVDTTKAPDTTAAPATGGCGGFIGGSIVVATAILGSAWVSKRR